MAAVRTPTLATALLGAAGVVAVIVTATASGRLGLVAAVAAPLIGAAAVVAGTRRYRPDRRVAWYLVALACAVHALAVALRADELLSGGTVDPGRPEAIALLAYPAMFVGVWAITTRASPHASDGPLLSVATVVATLVCWVVAVPRGVTDGALPFGAAEWVGIFALLDTALAFLVARRLIRVPRRNWSLWVMAAAFVVWGNAHGGVGAQLYDHTLELGTLAWAVLGLGPIMLGVAATLPDMADTADVEGAPEQIHRRAFLELGLGVALASAFVAIAAAEAGAHLLAAAGTASLLLVATATIVARRRPSAHPVTDVAETPDVATLTRPTAAPPPSTDGPADNTAEPPASAPPAAAVAHDDTRSRIGANEPAAPLPVAQPRTGTPLRPLGRDGARTAPTSFGGLATAASDGQLELQYLPYVDLASGRVVGVEALLRWRHPFAGLLSPTAFFEGPHRAIRERDAGRWATEQALADLASWPAPDGFLLGINASAAQLGDALWVEHLLDTCRRHDVDPRNLVVETTEETFDRLSSAIREHLARLRRHGVELAIDDFGRNVGSLRTLVEAPVGLVKIRAGAIAGGRAEPDPIALRAVAQTGHRTAVIGIDTTELLADTRELGVELGQGFRLCEPIDAPTVAARFGTRSAVSSPTTVDLPDHEAFVGVA